MFTELKQFIFLENAQDRYDAIKSYAQNSTSWQLNLLTWQILSLLPTNKEKITLAQSLKISSLPNSEWAIFSYLLQPEHDNETIRECILNLSRTKNHSLAERILSLIPAKMKEGEVFTAVLEYIENTGDERFKKILNNDEIFIYKEIYPEKILNSFLKLGVINQNAKDLSFSSLNQSANKDGSINELYAAVFYIFFSCNLEDISKLKKIKNEIKNYKLLALIDLCFSILNPIIEMESHQFFETALFQSVPLFIGYGTLSNESIIKQADFFIQKHAEHYPLEVTRTILSLKNTLCTELLSLNKILGIQALENSQHSQLTNDDHIQEKIFEIESPYNSKSSQLYSELKKIWIDFCPIYNEQFINSVKNPKNYFLWHNDNSELGFVVLDENALFQSTDIKNNAWQEFFEQSLKNNIEISINIIFFQIIALGKSPSPNSIYETKIIENIKLCLMAHPKSSSKISENFIDKIYALCISAKSSPQFIKEIYNFIPFSCTSWAFIAIALTAPKIEIQTLNYAILRELHTIRETLLNGKLDKDEYILEVTTRFQSIIIGADKFHVQVTQPTLIALKEIAILIQNVLDSVENTQGEDDEDFHAESGADWKGQIVSDKPIMRWNAILQVCLNQELSIEEKKLYEKILCEGLRVSPHVEKRWVVRALVRLDTDEAIKTILYQALHHIDADFVERTLFELFYSKHPRAKQALIRSISKNNIVDKIKIAIIEQMKNSASLEILHELKDLMSLRLPEKIEYAVQEAIIEISKKIDDVNDSHTEEHKFTSIEIDCVIKTFIRDVNHLSVDSRSALRTAEMIYIQSKDWGKEAVDLSPIVNMYCKSVELVLRDTFEPFTDSIMRKGELTKKLEALGYAKMLQDKMQEFEDYIAELPIINKIPYFSKFKLRKMLRAICLYRPGKRFTLDGPKAFALFLLVTGRKTCPYALKKVFNLPFLKDEDLFDFVKQVHSLQDSRNRAVHEGLTWEAREEIDNMRKQAYNIIDTCLKIGIKLTQHSIGNEVRAP